MGRYQCVGHDSVHFCDPWSGVEYFVSDLREPEGVLDVVRSHAITDIVHSGAISHPLLMDDQPSAVVAINVIGTLNILEAARLCCVTRVVFISSGAVYGFSSPDRICDEFSTLDPDNIYGATKAAGEMLIRGYGARFGLNFTILRLVSLYGPRRQTFYMPGYLLACAMDGIPTHIRGGDQAVDFIHVSDAGRAVVKALESTIGAGRVYNVATGVKHTYNEIADIVRTLVPGCRIKIEAGTGGFPRESQINIERAARDLGFRPAVDLQRGIEALYREFTRRPDCEQRPAPPLS
jgi:UDP-glucuronate 4-epimerase